MQDLASRGISDRSIAVRLGMTLAEFQTLVAYEYPPGTYKVKEALELARAEYEISRVMMKDNLLNDPEVSAGLKIKIIRDDLKVLENWAPATRAVTVKVQNDTAQEFSFESFSDEEQAKIVAAATASDVPTIEHTEINTDEDGDSTQ